VTASALSSGHHLLGAQFIRRLKSTVFVAQTRQNTKESIIMHNEQNPIELQPSILLTGVNWLLTYSMEQSPS